MKILILEDSKVQRESFAVLLAMSGHEVAAAGSASQATSHLVGGFRPDRVLLDYFLVDENEALSWLAEFRQRLDCRDVLVTIATAASVDCQEEIRTAVAALGPVKVVSKPTDRDTLEAALDL